MRFHYIATALIKPHDQSSDDPGGENDRARDEREGVEDRHASRLRHYQRHKRALDPAKLGGDP